MSESGLSIGYPDLKLEVGRFLGYGSAEANWSASQLAEIERVVQSGVRRVYFPPAIDANSLAYEWSWLRPTTTIDIESGTADYDLPDDFGRLIGALYYQSEEYKESIIQVSIGKILALRSYESLTGIPRYAAIRFKASTGASGQRQEILFYPEPDNDWTLSYEYEAFNGALSDTYPYPLGGMKFAELYIESCLAVAESRMNDEIGIHTQTYQALLIDAVARDRKNGAVYYGRMSAGDSELEIFRRGITGSIYPLTYKDEVI